MPYYHLSFYHTRKLIQHTIYFMYTKKKAYLPSTVQKNHFDLNLSLFPLFRLNTILVTNRWNRSHLSWILSKFLTFTLHTFVLTQICRSPSPMLSQAYFGALKWVQTQINIGEGKLHKCFKICDKDCSFVDAMDEQKRALLPGTVENSPADDLFAGHCPAVFVRSLLSFFIFRCGWFLTFFLIPNFTMLQTPCHSTHLAGVQVLNNPTKSR